MCFDNGPVFSWRPGVPVRLFRIRGAREKSTIYPGWHLSGMPTIRPCGLGDRSYTPDFESGSVPGEKLRKANKTLGICGFSPEQMSDSLSHIEFPRWTKSGRMFLVISARTGGLSFSCRSLLMQQHRYVIRALICGDESGGTVGVQVSHRHRLEFVTHGEGLLGLEGAIAIAQ